MANATHEAEPDRDYQVVDALTEGMLGAISVLLGAIINEPANDAVVGPASQATLQELFEESLYFLYRLVIVCYADSLELLHLPPLSLLGEIKGVERLCDLAERPLRPLETHKGRYMETLRALFGMLHEGNGAAAGADEALPIPWFDTLLFGMESTPVLDRCHISDGALQQMMGQICRCAATSGGCAFCELPVEALGSIYERLLGHRPTLKRGAHSSGSRPPATKRLVLKSASLKRKTLGTYYTPTALVSKLLDQALRPVVIDRLARAGLRAEPGEASAAARAGPLGTQYEHLSAAERAAGSDAILSIRVCDPAAGTGHFLVAALDALAEELARIRTGQLNPTEAQLEEAKAEVLVSCIYGVDLDPLAVELCKFSLWVNARAVHVSLGTLDGQIRCGNSLIGATRQLLARGIPTEAFRAVTGDDPKVASAVRARNRAEAGARRTAARSIKDSMTANGSGRERLEADVWTASFFWPLSEEAAWAPTHGELVRLRDRGGADLPAEAADRVKAIVERHRAFHWHLEFAGVLTEPPTPGFDVLLGNPPWERMKLQAKEFFAGRDAHIAGSRSAAARAALISELWETNPELADAYATAVRHTESEIRFMCNSNRYPLAGVGDVNTYALFVELCLSMLSPEGRAGLVVPSGIATDYTYRKLFGEIVNRGNLVSLWDFENHEGLFPRTHRSYRFSLLVLAGQMVPRTDFAFFLRDVTQLADESRHFRLTASDLALFNPNTRTCPVFRTAQDVELARKIYNSCPVLLNRNQGSNPWEISFLRMLDMTNDSHLFRTRGELEAQAAALCTDGVFRANGEEYLPLYEGRMIDHYDHRAASVAVNCTTTFRSGVTEPTNEAQHRNPYFRPRPRYWVEGDEVAAAIPDTYRRHWFVGFKDVTGPTNERTMVCTVIPRTAVGNKIPLILSGESARKVCGLVANLSSVVLDYVARQKMGGITLNFYIVEQLPVIPPERYTCDLLDFIVSRVLELTYTSWDLRSFAWDLGYSGPPFAWDVARRAQVRAELDATYAHLYQLSRAETAHVLDTFPITRRRDTTVHGTYLTKQLVLHYYDTWAKLVPCPCSTPADPSHALIR